MNTHLLPDFDQHGFRPGHPTTSALLQLTSDVATSFNKKKPTHRTICVAVDLTAAFDTVNHNLLLSKIARSTLPEATCRWLSNYIRGISYKLQRLQVEGKDNPYWRYPWIEVVIHVIQFLHSRHATADRTSQADLLRG